MKYVVFSDVHGNVFALEKMLQDLRGIPIEGFIYCGDIMGYYYNQEKVIDLMRQLKSLHIVKGNHDKLIENACRDRYKLEQLAAKYGNSYLKSKNFFEHYLSFLTKLSEKEQITINNKKIGIFHGTPQNVLEGRCYPDEDLNADQVNGFDVVFLGHTHYRMKKIIRNTIIVNPGSLGQPRDGMGFSYCIFDFKTMFCEFKTVEFKIDPLIFEVELNETKETHKKYLRDVLYR